MGYFEQCGYCRHCVYDPTSFTCCCCDRDENIVFPDDEACMYYMPDVSYGRG